MCKKVVNDQIKNYNFIISNVILTQKEEFTIEDIQNSVKVILDVMNKKIENMIKNCIIRLRENGYISELGSYYEVVA